MTKSNDLVKWLQVVGCATDFVQQLDMRIAQVASSHLGQVTLQIVFVIIRAQLDEIA